MINSIKIFEAIKARAAHEQFHTRVRIGALLEADEQNVKTKSKIPKRNYRVT